MRRSKWMAFIVITSFFITVPGYGLQLKIATLSPEGSAWMQTMQAGADEIHRKTNKRVRFKFFGGGIMGNDLITAEVLKRIGVNPIPLPIADVLTSLQTGLVDTIPAPPIAAIILQWHTRVRYLTEIPLSYSYGLLAIDRKTFEKIAPQDQQIVREVMEQVFKNIDHQNRKDHVAAMKVKQKNGIQFVRPTPEAEAEWRAAGIEVTQKLLEKGLISRQALEQLDSLLETSP